MKNLPTLTVNKAFMKTFLSSAPPCAALGLIEERGVELGFLAVRPDVPIPPEVTAQGFKFGHALLGTSQYTIIQFVFEFYGFGRYYVLINPNTSIAQTVISKMINDGVYFFLALNPDKSVTTFKGDVGEENVAGLKANFPKIQSATTTDEQYNKGLFQFSKNPDPSGTLLNWVCRDNADFLDLTHNRLDLSPRQDMVKPNSAQPPFQLPPEIKLSKEPVGSDWMYVFRHDNLGELGRIIVQGQSNGETKFTSELSGGPSDPMHQKRKEIFEPLSEQVMAFVESQLGKKARSVPPEPVGPTTKQVIRNKTEFCSTCNKPIAFLIFANQWENEGDLENTARLMYKEINRLNVPTWVIGEISGEGNPLNNSTIIKKVWPQREDMFEASPSKFNVLLEELDEQHCG